MLNVLIRPTSLMGLAGAPAEAVKPYEAKVEWLTWFQVSRGRLCGAEGGTVKAWADKLNNVFQWFWLKEMQSGLLFTFQNSCKFATLMGLCPELIPALPSSVWPEPVLYSSGRKPLPSIVKSWENLCYLLDYNKFDMSPINHICGVNITPDEWWRCDCAILFPLLSLG